MSAGSTRLRSYNIALGDDRIAAHAASLDFGTAKIELIQGNAVVQTIATAAPNGGRFIWTVPNLPANNYQIRVTANLPAAPNDASDDLFQIVPGGHDYYINDASTAGDILTTAVGDNANSGKTPDAPMASISALLQAYAGVLGVGDVIHVDTGTYPIASNIVLGANVSGITIQGPTTGPGALIDRGNSASGSNDFTFTGGDDITIDHLTLAGASIAVFAGLNAGSDRLTVSNCDITAALTGIDLESGNSMDKVLSNRIHDIDHGAQNTNGLIVNAAGATVDSNTITNDFVGIFGSTSSASFTNNTIAGNVSQGVNFGGNAGAGVTFSGNSISGSHNVGINIGGNVTANNNQIYSNRSGTIFAATGIQVSGGASASGNVISDNDNGAYVSVATFSNNRVFHNTGFGVNVGGQRHRHRQYDL